MKKELNRIIVLGDASFNDGVREFLQEKRKKQRKQKAMMIAWAIMVGVGFLICARFDYVLLTKQ